MPDPDVTIAEVFRSVESLRGEWKEGRAELLDAHRRMRDDVVTLSLDVKETEVRIETLERTTRDHDRQIAEHAKVTTADPVARWSTVGTGIGAAIAAALAWFHK